MLLYYVPVSKYEAQNIVLTRHYDHTFGFKFYVGILRPSYNSELSFDQG